MVSEVAPTDVVLTEMGAAVVVSEVAPTGVVLSGEIVPPGPVLGVSCVADSPGSPVALSAVGVSVVNVVGAPP